MQCDSARFESWVYNASNIALMIEQPRKYLMWRPMCYEDSKHKIQPSSVRGAVPRCHAVVILVMSTNIEV